MNARQNKHTVSCGVGHECPTYFKLSHSFTNLFTDTGYGVFNSCANSDTRSSSSCH